MIDKHLATARTVCSGMGLILSMENMEFLGVERELHETADSLGLTECQQCGYCCLRRACIPLPEEIPVVAKYLGLSPAQLVEQHMVVDISGDDYYPLWAGENQLDLVGKLLPYYRTYDRGYCHFFDRSTHLCKIYPVRPKSAVVTNCWDGDKKVEEIRAKWGINLIKQFLPNFVGEEE